MKEDLNQRLRRLRRDGPPAGAERETRSAAEGAAAPKPGLPVWLKHKLGASSRREQSSESAPTPGGPRDVGEPRDLVEFELARGSAVARTRWYGSDYLHGSWELGAALELDSEVLADVTGDATLDGFSLRDAVYLDIETTGLSGGAGVYPFMVALGQFRDSRFELWQGFLRSPDEEPALMEEVARRVASSSSVVSFFGKSFDRHRLEDKMRICGVDPPFEGLPHLDLYHPLQRLYGPAYSDGRLSTMERELCGVRREGDLPGSFAPAAWFDYLGGRAHLLESVFQHNADDVLSLVTLAAHLGSTAAERRPDGAQLEGPGVLRAVGMARRYDRPESRAVALEWVQRALDRVEGEQGRRRVLVLRADLLRLSGAKAQALEVYRELAQAGADDAMSVHALLQQAKLLEHGPKLWSEALSCCERARTLIDDVCVGRDRSRFRKDLDPREARLRSKLEGGDGSAELANPENQ